MRPLSLLLFVLTSFGFPARVAAQVKALRFGSVITGQGQVISNAVVLVNADRIMQVGSEKAIAIPAGAETIDLRAYTAIPGLIDAHTHLSFYWDKAPGSTPWGQLGSLSAPVTVFLAQENARKALETGVTTVRDLGSFDNMDLALRELINRGAMLGPRMLVAGNGLHVTSSPYKVGAIPDAGQCDGVADVQRVARQQLAAGVDWIKMYGSTGSDKDVTGFQTFSYEEMKAAVDVAHQAGKRIAIHSYGPDGARAAVRAGTNTVEHAIDMDDATLKAMAKQGIIYVPTVDHNRYYVAHKDEYGYDAQTVEGLNQYLGKNVETLKRAIKAKVKIAMGSDAVFTGFGENTRELEWFVQAGMSPEQALQTATTTGAEMLGLEKELGAIAPGYLADIVAVKGDPLQDIQVVIQQVKWVMKAGQVGVDKTKRADTP
ncbi:amidohydrolase family protein [Hymenobacter sp. BT188]|uniref:metal-dependent hydrolase family protein n=1 Tax=Hymenobacter sp. BT188 TaxID=2763504 RepID=UPI001651303F|nr:amidohydrolase family protein [Hymenobacter sp. BT188]MBC6608833.1 amidohydrolase family protein [Hymenobacter sp. BT188]